MCDGSVARAAAQVTELSLEAAQSRGAKSSVGAPRRSFDKQLSLPQPQHWTYNISKTETNMWYLDYPPWIRSGQGDALQALIKKENVLTAM